MMIKQQKSPTWLQQLTSLLLPKKAPRVERISHYHLKELFDEINCEYFSNSLENLSIDWSGRGKTSSKSVIRLGYYNPKKKIIKINRLLDTSRIPKYFISFIIYHEMLHHLLPPLQNFGSRRKIHHVQFSIKEREFKEYAAAQTFMKNLKKELFFDTRTPL